MSLPKSDGQMINGPPARQMNRADYKDAYATATHMDQ